MTATGEQRRGRSIAMTPSEMDDFLRRERTCRVGTTGADGTPHVSALWFVWDGTALWLNSVVRSQRWVNVQRQPRVSVLVDAGHDYFELRGVELLGRAEVVGGVPRVAGPEPEVEEPERLFAHKYLGREEPAIDGRHAWLRLVPAKVVSWDFRKLGVAPGADR
jgi:PPOX class probable F420-dependent enzyme